MSRCSSRCGKDTFGYCEKHLQEYQIGRFHGSPELDFPLIEETEADRNLEAIARDRQNVHTKPVVKQTLVIAKEMIELSKSFPKFDESLLMILNEGELSENAKKIVFDHYFSMESIYDLEPCTYRLVLNGVWIFIQQQKYSERKALIQRLCQELEDNVGTCSQGNLSRLCNTLQGYRKIEPEISLSDIMAHISREPNIISRISKARQVLVQNNIQGEEAKAWLEALYLA